MIVPPDVDLCVDGSDLVEKVKINFHLSDFLP